MTINEKVSTLFLRVLIKELDGLEFEEAEDMINHELNSIELKKVFRRYNHEINDEKTHFIAFGLLLGLGRNRIIKAMRTYNVKRHDVEETQDILNLKNEEIKLVNEKRITRLKWKTNARRKRREILDGVWEDIKKEYIEGNSIKAIGEKYNISAGIIKSQLQDEKLIIIERSNILKKNFADMKKAELDDEFIINLVNDNKNVSMVKLWKISKEKYPWLLRRQFNSKIKELGLSTSKKEKLKEDQDDKEI